MISAEDLRQNRESIQEYFMMVPDPLNIKVPYTVKTVALNGRRLDIKLKEDEGSLWVRLPHDQPADLTMVIQALTDTDVVRDLIKKDEKLKADIRKEEKYYDKMMVRERVNIGKMAVHEHTRSELEFAKRQQKEQKERAKELKKIVLEPKVEQKKDPLFSGFRDWLRR